MKQSKAAIVEPEIRILKQDTCASLSGRSILTFHIGCTDDSAVHIRVHQNTGQGYFSDEWVPFSAIDETLGANAALTANSLRSIFQGKSVNTAGFLLAVLKHLGLIETSKDNRRCYTRTTSDSFTSEVNALIASPVALPATASEAPVKKGTLKAKPKQSRRSPLE